MLRETLALTAIQSGILFLALWWIFRLAPSIPANAKAWLWRLAFLKPLLCLLPFAVVTLPILPVEKPAAVVTNDVIYSSAAVESVQDVSPVVPVRPSIDPLLILWGIGVLGVGAFAAIGMRKAWQVTKTAKPVREERLLTAFQELLEKANVHRHPNLVTSNKISTAMLVGGRHYAVVLPETALRDCPFEDLRLMMAHEVAHIARQDLFWFSLVSAVQSLFFFNPMVWVAVRCSRLDHESATDRHASHLAGVPIQTYADMLLRATIVTRPSLAPGILPVAESYRTIHRRLEAMKHFNSKPTFWRRTATVALAMLTLGMLPAYNLVAAAWPMASFDLPTEVVASQEEQTGDAAQTRQQLAQEAKRKKEVAAQMAKRAQIDKELVRLKARQDKLVRLREELNRKDMSQLSRLSKQRAELDRQTAILKRRLAQDAKQTQTVSGASPVFRYYRVADVKGVKTNSATGVVTGVRSDLKYDTVTYRTDLIKQTQSKDKANVVFTRGADLKYDTVYQAPSKGNADVVYSRRSDLKYDAVYQTQSKDKADAVFTYRTAPKYDVIYQTQSKDNTTVRGNTQVTTGAAGSINRNKNNYEFITVTRGQDTSGKGIQWKVVDRKANSGNQVWKAWTDQNGRGESQTSSGQYQVTGKNVTITIKDGVYYISADGPITIRQIGGKQGQSDPISDPTKVSPGGQSPREGKGQPGSDPISGKSTNRDVSNSVAFRLYEGTGTQGALLNTRTSSLMNNQNIAARTLLNTMGTQSSSDKRNFLNKNKSVRTTLKSLLDSRQKTTSKRAEPKAKPVDKRPIMDPLFFTPD